ncbi:DNA mismatch repair protein MLH3 isoform X2 [Andrographis paniculata]|uniref:DNA mismatch repair protein MLH3 isoform X2 n=1 Tax=Andrographis paniculata TaxID=175694 RepID=UPI0021E9A2DC|nr:DNA mismatch repair protein MLH3 isoform X2 [Andrographis paniculata]
MLRRFTMRNVERLPESVRSSVRSGVVIADLTKIVEELIFNSLEAGATKIYAAVGVRSCYVKVVDNGSGISRDGLVLLGERQATSKVDQMTLMDTGFENLDSHGEALCSISNVSLLEIVTKARGKPNGYKKIMKNRQCMFLGISDDRQEVGTTVIVRDIFYNQPVRRKHMESSPSKLLDSIKMTVLRIALVHVNICFKVVDMESAYELLHTGPLSSPLQLLSSTMGIGDSVSFYNVDLSDSNMKLSGFISGPCEKFHLKVIQYVYINSRFVCKGPIHKCINQLAVKFDCSLSRLSASSSQNDKQNKYDICPTFVLNLCCQRSCYDMIDSGQSRRLVEFKDWGPVLTFIEEGITRVWAQNISHDMSDTSRSNKRNRKQDCQISLNLSSPQQKKLCKRYDSIPDEYFLSLERSPREIPKLEKHHTVEDFSSETEYQRQTSDESLADYGSYVKGNIRNHLPADRLLLLKNVPHTYDTKVDYQSSSALGNILPEFDNNINNMSTLRGAFSGYVKFGHNVLVGNNNRKCLLRNCSFERSPSRERLPAQDELLEFGTDDKILKRWLGCDDGMLNEISLATRGRDLRHNRSSLFQSSSMTHYDMHEALELPDFSEEDWKGTSILHSFRSGWSPMATEKLTGINCNDGDDEGIYRTSVDHYSEFGTERVRGIKFHDDDETIYKKSVDHYSEFGTENVRGIKFHDDYGDHEAIYEKSVDSYSEFGKEEIKEIKMHNDDSFYKTSVSKYSEIGAGFIPGCSALRKEEDLKFSNLNTKDRWSQQKGTVTCFSSGSKSEITEFPWRDAKNVSCWKPFKKICEMDWSPLPSYVEESPKNCSMELAYETPLEHGFGKTTSRKQTTIFNRNNRYGRSQSAPPCYKGKQRYLDLTDSFTILSAKCTNQNSCTNFSSNEPSNSNCASTKMKSQKSVHSSLLSGVKRSSMNCSFTERQGSELTGEIVTNQSDSSQKGGQRVKLKSVECLDMKEHENSFDSGCKWRNCCPSTADENMPNYWNQDNILDICDILDLAGESLVPKSIDRMTLEDAKVLNQVDKKFIPVVAGKNLAIIDQHAADERIRLEELRHKVLTGEMRTITYLDTEQELVLPEIGYQLLHNYAEQIQNWGWICNIHSQDRSSFSKHLDCLHRQPTVAKLHAVPCVLGVNLTDMDLLEFLQQLADTDGSSTVPPSVTRILNSKACRGAIMFGDTLLPSECSLIVDELKRTSLCFQCAHGRPTTVPLVNLDVLHHTIAKNHSPKEPWHGLSQHKLSLERITRRLNSTPP